MAEVIVLLILAALALFLPASWLRGIGIEPSHTYHLRVLLVFWGSLIYVIIFGGANLWRLFESYRYLTGHLGADEDRILQEFIARGAKTCQFPAWYAGITGLVEKRILIIDRHVTPDAEDGGVLVCRIKNWAFHSLVKRKEKESKRLASHK